MTEQTQAITSKIEFLHNELKKAQSLKPCENTDQLFTELVKTTMDTDYHTAKKVINNPSIQKIKKSLNKICSEGEFEMEMHWAESILKDENPSKALANFIYYQNYQSLIELEYKALKLISTDQNFKTIFVGSGPLSLTSILLSEKYNLKIDNLEMNKDAAKISNDLIKKLNLNNQINTINQNLLNFSNLKDYDLVYVASLVGITKKDKKTILEYLSQNMKPGSFLLIRSAHDLKTLLYPKITLKSLKDLKVHLTLNPNNEVINSIIIAQKPH